MSHNQRYEKLNKNLITNKKHIHFRHIKNNIYKLIFIKLTPLGIKSSFISVAKP